MQINFPFCNINPKDSQVFVEMAFTSPCLDFLFLFLFLFFVTKLLALRLESFGLILQNLKLIYVIEIV